MNIIIPHMRRGFPVLDRNELGHLIGAILQGGNFCGKGEGAAHLDVTTSLLGIIHMSRVLCLGNFFLEPYILFPGKQAFRSQSNIPWRDMRGYALIFVVEKFKHTNGHIATLMYILLGQDYPQR